MDDWDSIDWDEKVENIIKKQQKQTAEEDQEQSSSATGPTFIAESDDGNYFASLQEKKKLKEQKIAEKKSRSSAKKDEYIQPYSSKDLVRIRNFASSSTTFPNLIYETFGQFERFLMTHKTDLTDEAIVELLIIDVALLEVPFHQHNQILLKEISKCETFWSQLIEFLKEFFESKHKNLNFLLVVDMNGFFNNIESLLHNLLVNNHFESCLESIFEEILRVMESHQRSSWSRFEQLKKIQEEYRKNCDVFKIYDIYPKLEEFGEVSREFQENLIKGEYESVSHYLQIHLPLLKEDFLSKLRSGVAQLRLMSEEIHRVVKTQNIWIFPKVRIVVVSKFQFNMSCKSMVVKLNVSNIDWSKRFFNGQLLCFSSSKEFKDLILATVSREIQSQEITIEILKTENISDIFDKDLIMIEPTTFFEPYHKVFNVLKNQNEINFPFKNQILKLKKDKKFPSYEHSDQYSYKNFTFNVKNLSKWPSSHQLSLEEMQLKAIQAAITQDFTIIQGPPGTGKTFIGLEILKILLDNTDETILILTQTNNALDKFLLGASKFTDSIARMGGQSKSEELEKFISKKVTSLESKKYMKKLQAEISQTSDFDESKIYTHHRLIEEIHQLSSFTTIKDRRIIGMTTTFAARSSFINKMLKPGIVIVEEASEVLESHVLVSLTKETKQLIMIGDHQQLRPLTNSYDLVKNCNFNISLFERLIRNDFDFITLDVQMRMRGRICDLVRGTIYKTLKDGGKVADYPDVKGMSENFFCVNHSQEESIGDGETSKENPFEAEFLVQLCSHLISSGNEAKQITILTAYAAQSQRIRKRLKELSIANVRVAVLDAYQGEESDIILLSLVRSNNRREIGFLATENRIAVVLSRAKFGFYIVANMECLAEASSTWRKIRDIMRGLNVIGEKIPGFDF